jgi:glycosyltransferase involved in cell wall biosynthesis
VLRDGETGLLTKADARELADAAIGLLLDPARRIQMGRAARRTAEQHFSATRQLEVMVAQYQRAAPRRR